MQEKLQQHLGELSAKRQKTVETLDAGQGPTSSEADQAQKNTDADQTIPVGDQAECCNRLQLTEVLH